MTTKLPASDPVVLAAEIAWLRTRLDLQSREVNRLQEIERRAEERVEHGDETEQVSALWILTGHVSAPAVPSTLDG
jgi:hypothetical protein